MRISDWSSTCALPICKWLDDVKTARPKAKVDAFIADTPAMVKAAGNDLSKASLDAGLVDKLGSRMAFGERVAEISGTYDDDKPWDFQAIPLDNWVAANPPSEAGSAIGVVPGGREIGPGKASTGPRGGAKNATPNT